MNLAAITTPETRSWILDRSRLILVLPLILLAIAACSRLGTPAGWSGGTVVDDTLYIGTRQGDLVALDIVTGRPLWAPFELKGEDPTRAIYGTPFAERDYLYFGGYDGILYGLYHKVAKGVRPELQQLWPKGGFKEDEAYSIVGGPAVAGDLLLLGSSDGYLHAYAFDGSSVNLEWSFPTNGKVWSTPVVVDGVAYFGSLDNNVYAISIDRTIQDDDRLIWKFPTQGGVAAPPVVSDGHVYVGSFDGNFYAIETASGREAWKFSDSNNWYWARAVVTDGTVYAPSLDGNLYALDAETGSLLWVLETEGPIVGSPAIVHTMIAVPSVDGKLYVASLEDGALMSRCNVKSALKTPLAEHDGVLYFGAQDNSIRALAIDSRGRVSAEWAYFTDNTEGPEMWVCVGPT